MLPDRRAGLLLSGTALLLFAALGGSVVLPSTDPALARTSESRRSLSAEAERGMRVYRSEGCAYCHTQVVRPVGADSKLGSPLAGGDYRGAGTVMLGTERAAPDLTHFASRAGDDESIRRILASDRSSMPSYAYLSRAQRDALIAYLRSLK
jgi:cbb3-type cytochrome oxidase cytochrome c subunit